MMQGFELITCLPSTLSCIVLREWLDLKSVMALDSAYCIHSLRKDLLDLLQSNEYTIKHKVMFDPSTLECCSVACLLERFGTKLRYVEIVHQCWWDTTKYTDLKLLESLCNNLTQVKFSGVLTYTQRLCGLLRSNPYIESLTVINDGDDAAPFLCSFNDIQLPNLRTFVLKNHELQVR